MVVVKRLHNRKVPVLVIVIVMVMVMVIAMVIVNCHLHGPGHSQVDGVGGSKLLTRYRSRLMQQRWRVLTY